MVYERTRPTGVNATTLDGVSLDSDNRLPAAQTPTAPTCDTISERTAAAGVTIDGLLVKDNIVGASGGTLGFYGTTAAARPAAYTQTYSTATRTHANATSATLTDNTGQTPNTTIDQVSSASLAGADLINTTAVEGRFSVVNLNFCDVTDQINKLRADLLNLKQVVNQMIDDDQTLGLKQ